MLGGADQDLGQRDGLLHRRLDVVQAEPVGGLLGVVDDVVERRGQRVAVGDVEGRPGWAGSTSPVQPVDDVVGDAVALLLAEHQLARQVGVLRVVGEQVAQQQARPLHVAP